MPNIGHNTFAGDKLKQTVERIERLEEEKKAISEDIKEVYSEAKALGFDVKVLRKLIALRKRDRHEVEEEQTMLNLYMHALGMTPGEEIEEQDDVEEELELPGI